MDAGPILFLGAGVFHVRLDRRQLSECLHSPNAHRSKRRFTSVALSALRLFHSVVSEYPALDLALSAGQVRELQGVDFHPLFPGRTADWPHVPFRVAGLRSAIARIGPGVLYFDRR